VVGTEFITVATRGSKLNTESEELPLPSTMLEALVGIYTMGLLATPITTVIGLTVDAEASSAFGIMAAAGLLW
jgi:hypothetical protein